jgi:hypothetical protein
MHAATTNVPDGRMHSDSADMSPEGCNGTSTMRMRRRGEGITRRRFLATAALALLSGRAEGRMLEAGGEDPVLRLWRDWQDTSARAEALARECAWIERKLMARIGPPALTVDLGAGKSVALMDPQGLARLCAAHPDLDLRHLDEMLCRRLEQWHGEADACGLSAGETHVDALDRQVDALVQQIVLTSARSRKGIAAKLSCALDQADPVVREDGPWLLVRSALRDLDALE